MRNLDIGYNSEIQALRAFSVFAVILCHLNGILPGGFMGVDIFFVISGYVITQSIIKNNANGKKFKISQFYIRRINRILPAFYVVSFVTLICAILLLPTSQFKFFISSFFSSIGMVSNIFFWRELDYFSPEAAYILLLHTWSLAIEEQFYIFFPILFLVFEKKYVNLAILLIVVLS